MLTKILKKIRFEQLRMVLCLQRLQVFEILWAIVLKKMQAD